MSLKLILPLQWIPQVSVYEATLTESQGYDMGDDTLEPQKGNTVSRFHIDPSLTFQVTLEEQKQLKSRALEVNYSSWYMLDTSVCSQPLKSSITHLR